MRRLILIAIPIALACGPEGAPNAQRQVLREHVPRVKEILQLDRQRHRDGVIETAERIKRGFLVEDRARLEGDMRRVLQRLQEPPRGVAEFIASPMAFLAAVGDDGIVIARDSDDDHMRGQNFAEAYPVVQAALQEGTVGRGIGEFAALEEGAPPSYSILFAAPSRHEGEVVGAVVAGIPLWREAQRLSRQLRVELATEIAEGLIVWVYLYKGDRIFESPEAPPEVTAILPDSTVREAGFARSPGGFSGDVQLHTKWYGYAVVPTPAIGEDIGVIVIRADPPG
ncbi:MAG: hypothetical protein AAGE52_11120 [Myxococcota bacterium]